MRILYFSQDYTTHDRRFLEALSKTNHDIYFMSMERSQHAFEQRPMPAGVTPVSWSPVIGAFPEPARLTDQITPSQIEQEISSVFKNWDVLQRFKQVVDTIKPDLIQAGPVQTCALLAALARFHPLVSTSWGSDLLVEAECNDWMSAITGYVLQNSDALVGDCNPVRQKAVKFGMPDERIITFPWGIDLQKFNAQAYLFRSNGAFRLLSTRSWEPIYGVDLIVKAFSQVVQQLLVSESLVRNLKPELVLLGNGSQASQLQSLIHQEKINNYVILPGRIQQDELPSLYGSAALYISASHSDGTSISLLEAMGCARAVLVSDIPGNREWVSQEVEGWLFPDGDVQALKRAILKAMKERDRLPEMGLAGRKKVERLANWEKNFPKLLEAYQIAIQFNS